jgi:hypothetical protein
VLNIKKAALRFSTRLDQHLKFFELSRNAQDSLSIWILSLLAGIFLPFSLATGLLGMQTRFTDLHYLLYKFCGVILIETLLVGALLGLKTYLFLTEKLAKYDTHRKFKLPIELPLRVLFWVIILPGWALLLSSFLVGMKDVVTGLRILGYSFAAYIE